MIDPIDQLNRLAELWWIWTVGMFWQVGLLILIVACLDAMVRKWAWPQIRYALWLLVLIKLLLPPDLHLASSVSSKLPSMAAQVFSTHTIVPESERLVSFSIVEASTGTSVGMNAVTPPRRAVGLRDKDLAADPPVFASPPPVKPSWQCYALALWCLGMLVLSTWLWGKLRGLRRGVSDASGNESLAASLDRLVPQCAEQLGLSRVPEIRLTRSILCPAVTGIFRPVLLMPVDFLSKLSPKSTEHMLLHEFAHIKRGDLYVHGVYMILQIVYWYNPLLWLVSRQMHHLREICCDATVAQHLKDRTMEYRQTLLDIAKRYVARSVEPGLGLLGLFEGSNRLAVRLNCLKRETGRYPRVRAAMALGVVVLMMVCVLPMAQAHNEEIAAEPPALEQSDESVARQMAALATQIEGLELERQQLQRQMAKLQDQSRHGKRPVAHQTPQAIFVESLLRRIRPDLRAREQAKLAAEAAAQRAQDDLLALETLQLASRKARGIQTTQRQSDESREPEKQEKNWRQWQQEMEAWAQRMEDYGRRMEAWTKSPQFQAFQQRVENQAEVWSPEVQRLLPPHRDSRGLAPGLSPPQLPPASTLPALPRVPTLSPLPVLPLRPSVPPTVPEPLFPDLRVEKPVVLPTPAVQVAPHAASDQPGLRSMQHPRRSLHLDRWRLECERR